MKAGRPVTGGKVRAADIRNESGRQLGPTFAIGSQQLASLTIDEMEPRACRTGNAFKLSFARVGCFQPELNVLIGYRAFENEWLTHHQTIMRDAQFHVDRPQVHRAPTELLKRWMIGERVGFDPGLP
jgi:hypothetical protein